MRDDDPAGSAGFEDHSLDISGKVPSPLHCPACGRTFAVADGIPLLFPDNVDMGHIEEEEKLAKLMTGYRPSGKEIFFEEQWQASKEEYWSFVESSLPGGGMTILNAGCGIDVRFLGLADGNRLVAFDLMSSLLEKLGREYGSKNNVAGSVEALPFRENSFDALCCVDLIHHQPDMLEEIISSFFKVLKPGGSLFLEDINALALFQFWKSVLLPRTVHGTLRSLYHRLKGSPHQPALYEFPTSVRKVARILDRAGFTDIEAVPQEAYPNTGPAGYRIYRTLSRIESVSKYHNFHYLLRARKRAGH